MQTFCQTSSKLSVKISCKSERNPQIAKNLNYTRVRNAGRFRNLQSFYHIQFSINEQHIIYYRNVRGIMSLCRQIRYTMRQPPSSFTFSNRIRHRSIEFLISFFVSLSHADGITAERHSTSSYCWSSCRVSSSWCPELHNQVNWGHRN